MYQAYTIYVEKEAINHIHKQPYNLVNISGYVKLVKTNYEEADDLVYFLLEDLDYNEVKNYQSNILVLGVNEIEDYGKRYIKNRR